MLKNHGGHLALFQIRRTDSDVITAGNHQEAVERNLSTQGYIELLDPESLTHGNAILLAPRHDNSIHLLISLLTLSLLRWQRFGSIERHEHQNI
jgi:hypothetical protein